MSCAQPSGRGPAESQFSPHSVPADQSILQRVRKSMTTVERTGNVGRGERDDEALLGLDGLILGLGLEEAALLPPGVPSRLHGLGRVGLEVRVGLVVERMERLLLAGRGRVLERREDLLRGLLLRFRGRGALLLLLLLRGLRRGLLLCLLLLLCRCDKNFC